MFLLFYRGKNDPVGRNVTMSNPVFRKALDKHLAMLEADILAGSVEELWSDDIGKK